MADRIFVLENGCLAEVGTHTELIEKNGIYANTNEDKYKELFGVNDIYNRNDKAIQEGR